MFELVFVRETSKACFYNCRKLSADYKINGRKWELSELSKEKNKFRVFEHRQKEYL